jgi:hypothetical protein
MTDGTKGGAQRARSLRPRCVGEVHPETMTHIYLSVVDDNHLPKHVAVNLEYINECIVR